MAVTAFQSEILKLIARSRKDGGETFIAGGHARNHQLQRPRVSSQPPGLLAWAANGKGLGLTPLFILEMGMRTRYCQTVALPPPEQVGKAVMNKDGTLFNGTNAELKAALAAGSLEFHEGTLGGVWPRIIDEV